MSQCSRIEIDQEDKGNDDESVQLINDNHGNEKSFQPVMKPMLGTTTQSNNGQENAIRPSPTQPSDEAQPNKVQIHDKQITTQGLQCTELGCAQTFVQNEHLVDQLSDHMWNVHSIRALRCKVKDCDQLFKNSSLLGSHIKEAHGNVREWHCAKCAKRFTTCQLLAYHHTQHHQLGYFECPFPGCTFTGEYRAQVYFHSTQHKPDLMCQHVACHYRTKKLTQFKAHEGAHLGIKPYRCKWSICNYTSASRHNTMTHIKNVHFSSKTNQQDLSNRGNPNDYLGVSKM